MKRFAGGEWFRVRLFQLKQMMWMLWYEPISRSVPRILFMGILFPLWRITGGRKAASAFVLYSWLRHIDNIADGDLPFLGEENILPYLDERFRAIETEKILRPEDELLVYAIKRYPFSATHVKIVAREILSGVRSEWVRKRDKVFSSLETLSEEAVYLGEGTMRAFALAFDYERYISKIGSHTFISSGIPQWLDWMSGTTSDLRKGIVTLPKEVMEQTKVSFGEIVTLKDWNELLKTAPVKQWFSVKLAEYRKAFDDFKQNGGFEDLYGASFGGRAWKKLFLYTEQKQIDFLSKQVEQS